MTMTLVRLTITCLVAGSLLAGCKTTEPAATPAEEPSAAAEPATPADCVTTQTAAMLAVQPGAGAVVDWSGVTTDREGQPLDPAAIDEFRLMFYALEPGPFIEKMCGPGLGSADIAYVVQEGALQKTTSTPFDSSPHAGRGATLELISEGKVRKYVFAGMDEGADSTTFLVKD